MIDDNGADAPSGVSESSPDRERDLVFLTFRAVLRRDPAESDAVAFANALRTGMSMVDFIAELMAAPEFRTTSYPSSSVPAPQNQSDVENAAANLLALSTTLLQRRLADKGCPIQIGPTLDPPHDPGRISMQAERVSYTLAFLELL